MFRPRYVMNVTSFVSFAIRNYFAEETMAIFFFALCVCACVRACVCVCNCIILYTILDMFDMWYLGSALFSNLYISG